jgi:hypothetical protein
MMPVRSLTVTRPQVQAMSSARLEGLRLAQAQSFATSTSSLISLIFSGPLSRMRLTTRRTSSAVTPLCHGSHGPVRRARIAGMKYL